MNYKLELTQQELDYLGNLVAQRPYAESAPMMNKLLASAQERDAALAADNELLAQAKAAK
ncbi:MAG: hypothetical protein AB3X44_16055 [Leptothrix sp. (in: b-proteobacteria)]